MSAWLSSLGWRGPGPGLPWLHQPLACQSPLPPTGGRERCHGELLPAVQRLHAPKPTDATSVHIPRLETSPWAGPRCKRTWAMQSLEGQPSGRISSPSGKEEHELWVDNRLLGQTQVL